MARKRKETTVAAPFLKRLSLPPEKMEHGPNGASTIDYRDTDHFKLYERFPRGPEAQLKHLLDDEADNPGRPRPARRRYCQTRAKATL